MHEHTSEDRMNLTCTDEERQDFIDYVQDRYDDEGSGTDFLFLIAVNNREDYEKYLEGNNCTEPVPVSGEQHPSLDVKVATYKSDRAEGQDYDQKHYDIEQFVSLHEDIRNRKVVWNLEPTLTTHVRTIDYGFLTSILSATPEPVRTTIRKWCDDGFVDVDFAALPPSDYFRDYS